MDHGNDRIRRFNRLGVANFSGDCASAFRAGLNAPRGLAMDFQKNHYIAGTSNDAIRMIIPQGNIATNAGTPGTNNSVLVSDINNQRVRRVFLGVK